MTFQFLLLLMEQLTRFWTCFLFYAIEFTPIVLCKIQICNFNRHAQNGLQLQPSVVLF